MSERPTLEELRRRQEQQADRGMEERMARRWAKDQLLCWAAGRLLEYDARLPEDAPEVARAYNTLLKTVLREFWDSYEFPPDFSYPRPFADFEPPDDFDFGAAMERMHEEADRRWREQYGDADPPYGPPDLPKGTNK